MEEKYAHITGVDIPIENEANNELPTDLFKVASSISDEALAIAHEGIALFANERLYTILKGQQ